MADNKLLPYSQSLFNPATSWNADAPQRLNLSYPSWMTDNAARGIGNVFTPDYTAPGDSMANIVPAYNPVATAQNTDVPSTSSLASPIFPSGIQSENTGGFGGPPGHEASGNFMGDVGGLLSGLGRFAGDAYAGAARALGADDGGAQAAADASAASGPGGAVGGAVDGGYGGSGDHAEQAPSNFHGGILTKNKLVGPDPDGPDDGFASVQSDEGVLTRKALKHYGPGIVNKLNKLMVSKAAFR